MNLLIIPDAHSKPECSTDRFDVLGKYIVDTKPDTIVCLGDFLDFASLSSYDKGKASAENQRFTKDCEAGERDMRALFSPLAEYNKEQRAKRKARYLPSTYFTVGNHEERLDRFANDNPAMADMSSVQLIQSYGFWDTVVPFKEPLMIEGIAFCHYWASDMGRALGGENAARNHTLKNFMSSVSGHSHKFNHCVQTRIDGTKFFGLVAGCYIDAVKPAPSYATGASHRWWNGLVTLKGVKNGFYESMETISQEALLEKYFG